MHLGPHCFWDQMQSQSPSFLFLFSTHLTVHYFPDHFRTFQTRDPGAPKTVKT